MVQSRGFGDGRLIRDLIRDIHPLGGGPQKGRANRNPSLRLSWGEGQ